MVRLREFEGRRFLDLPTCNRVGRLPLQHIICDADGSFTAIEEGDYGELTATIGGRIVCKVPGELDDSY